MKGALPRGAGAPAGVLAALVGALAAGGCTTDLGSGSFGGYDKSTLIALSDPVMGMTVAGSSVYWIDGSGSVWSCDKLACDNAPKRLHAGSEPLGASAQMGVSGDWLFWVIDQSIFGCPTSGCPSGTLTALGPSIGVSSNAPAFAIDTAGGTGAYWFGQPTQPSGPGSPVVHYPPGCDAGCPETVFQASGNGGNADFTFQCAASDPSCVPCNADTDCPAGQFCSNYPGGPSPAACSPRLLPGDGCDAYPLSSPNVCVFGTCEGTCPGVEPQTPSGLVIAAGTLYFVTQTPRAAVVSCPVAGCSLSTLSTYWSPTTGAAAPVLFGATASALYFTPSEGPPLASCSLPACSGTPGTVSSGADIWLGASSTDFYVTSDLSQYATACPFTGCPSGYPAATPDPSLDSTPLGRVPFGRPFALDGTAIVWATSTIFGQPGNQIERTPAP